MRLFGELFYFTLYILYHFLQFGFVSSYYYKIVVSSGKNVLWNLLSKWKSLYSKFFPEFPLAISSTQPQLLQFNFVDDH